MRSPTPAATPTSRINRFILLVPVTFTLIAVFLARSGPTTRSHPGVPTQATAARLLEVMNRDGLSASLDTLRWMAARDSLVLRDAHQLAHALGRQALRQARGSPAVLAQCRPVFAAGCYHGVVEAYLDQSRRIDMTELERMCAAAGSEQNPAPVYECTHGLGHGILGALGLDLPRTLRLCDSLPDAQFASACQEGAFMEAIGSAMAGPMHHPGGEPHGHPAMAHAGLALDPTDPYAPCDQFDGSYAASCWPFQGAVILRQSGFEPGAAFRTCDAAPARFRQLCYRGLGLQLAGLFQRDDRWILEQCAKGRPDLAPSCAAGATIALTEMDWTGARTLRFCAASRVAWKEACYRLGGSRLAFVTSPTRLAVLCGQVEGEYVEACRESAGLVEAR